MIAVTITIWLLLGIHSAWFFVKRFTQKNDLTTNELWMVIVSLLFPIVSHFATFTVYPNLKPRTIKKRILIEKK
jgi:hypothetical protein